MYGNEITDIPKTNVLCTDLPTLSSTLELLTAHIHLQYEVYLAAPDLLLVADNTVLEVEVGLTCFVSRALLAFSRPRVNIMGDIHEKSMRCSILCCLLAVID